MVDHRGSCLFECVDAYKNPGTVPVIAGKPRSFVCLPLQAGFGPSFYVVTGERWFLFPTNLIGHYSRFRGTFRILAAGQEVPSANFCGTCFTRIASASIGAEKKVFFGKEGQ